MINLTEVQKNIKLSSRVTVEEYLNFERTHNREKIAELIQERFTERYITPLQGDSDRKNGFCITALFITI